MTMRSKGPARSAGRSQGTAAATVMLTPNPTQTMVRISEKQSLHIMQTTVSAALSAILCINNLFPDDYFETRRYNLDDPAFSYSVKPASQSARESKQQENDNASVSWDFLLKGKTAKADKIWLWLDGICDAIKHRYLASFQISFHNGAVCRNTMTEAYVMKFSYSENGSEIQLDISSGKQTVEFTAKDMQKLKSVFSKLLKMSRETDKSPGEPTISLQLTYSKTCPVDYEPRGFVVAPDTSIIMDQNGSSIGEIDTRYHSVGMSLVIPPRTASHDSNGSFGVVTQSNSQQASNVNNVNNLISTQAMDSPCDGSSVLNTQERADRQLLRDMVPMRREVGDTQRVQDTQSQRTAAERSSSLALLRGRVEKNTSPQEERRFYFDPEAIRDLFPTQKWRNEQVKISFTEGQDTDCHCFRKFAGMTVQCEICQDRQHLQCYGYLETDVMETHICYKCLLVSEPDLKKEMQRLCLLRQVAWVACMERYPLKEANLAERIGCKVKDVGPLSQRLVKDNYLRKISRPQNKKHRDYNRRSEIPPYEFITEERERLLKEYLNPTYKIEEYLHEHPQTSADKPQPEQPSSPMLPLPRMSSIRHEVPNTQPPATPHPTRAKLISTGPIYGIFDIDDDDDDDDNTASVHPGTTVTSSMDCSTEGNSSHMGSPGPRPPLGVKRKADVLEGSSRTPKRPSWVNSPFVLNRAV